jgi:dihydroflavonol-4-reductase
MILVTGAANNIGQELVQQLLSAGFSLKLTGSPNDDWSRWEKYSHQIQFVQSHILDVTEIYEIVKDVEAVFHCDTINEYQTVSYENRMKYNVEGTANIVNAMLYHGVKKIIFFSSLKAMISVPNKISDENSKADVNEWTTEFALSMILAEREIWRGSVEGLDVNIINCADILVNSTSGKNLYSEAIRNINRGKVEIYPSNIEYVVVKDVVNLSLKILHGNHWNASWLALGGSINPSRFYQLIANHSSSNWKPIMMQSHSVYFKRVNDFFKSVLKGKERTFRKANGKFLMTNFQFNNELTTQTFEMHWNSIENWIKQNLRK